MELAVVLAISEGGVKIVVTDYGEGVNTDFIFSARAYTKLARPNRALELFSYGVVGLEYRKVPCQYAGINLMVKVHQYSKYPDYLALFLLYQSGINDVTSVQLWQEDCQEWRGMRREYGGIWDMANPPKGALSLRFQLSGPSGFMKWVQVRDAIPSDILEGWAEKFVNVGKSYATAVSNFGLGSSSAMIDGLKLISLSRKGNEISALVSVDEVRRQVEALWKLKTGWRMVALGWGYLDIHFASLVEEASEFAVSNSDRELDVREGNIDRRRMRGVMPVRIGVELWLLSAIVVMLRRQLWGDISDNGEDVGEIGAGEGVLVEGDVNGSGIDRGLKDNGFTVVQSKSQKKQVRNEQKQARSSVVFS
ncbi:hypothetical protein LguiB_034452 [Lonicera macranthoides]